MNNLLIGILAADIIAIFFNVFTMFSVDRKLKKLDRMDVTGHAIILSELGILTPINFIMTLINIIYVMVG